jgi:sucrose phosphorylase
LQNYWAEVITCVHILPFFPYSSDDGFSIIDYREVRADLGTWNDIEAIAAEFDLMSDLVINHMSSQSQYFQQFLAQESPGKDYVLTIDSTDGFDHVVRPRNTPFFTPYETTSGKQLVWTTFSADQIDWDFQNPDVLIELVDILLGYCQRGCRFIRLDAVGYLWKQIHTSCIHLPETHVVVQLLNQVLRFTYPSVALITETNVPNRENLSYFGDRNEAHLIYNFSLPPLVLNSLVSGEVAHLKTWIMSMPPAPKGCTYFNFTASHDGIGLRPTEGLLEAQEFEQLLHTMKTFGGLISYRKQTDGSETPYELNISWFDALQGTHTGPDQWQRQRFLCSQAIMMSLEGVPAFYIHSLLATPNDQDQVAQTEIKRRINRHQWDLEQLEATFKDKDSDQAWVFTHLKHFMAVRSRQPAFHPNATQFTMNLHNPAVLGLWRQSRDRDQSIFSLHNLSHQPQIIELKEVNLICIDSWSDLLSPDTVFDGAEQLTLTPYQTAWITNRY